MKSTSITRNLPVVSPATIVPVVRERDYALEGLRGLAALMVFYEHLMTESIGGWRPAAWWTWPVSGPAAVLVFFVLSGFVIGLTCAERSAASRKVIHYAWRRVLRLVPINCFAVLISCAVAQAIDWPTALGNLFFLQNFSDYAGRWVLVLRENYNLWSLNYEMVFYALFALLWWRRLSLAWTIAATVLVGGLGWFGIGAPVFVACYAFGFLFWLAGLALAWRAPPAASERSNWPSAVLLAVVTWKLHGLGELMLTLIPSPPRFSGPVVKLYDLDFLPVCVWLVAAVSRRTFAGFKALKAIAVMVPLLGLALQAVKSPELRPSDLRVIAAVYLSALALWRWQPSVRGLGRFAWFGMLAYGLYATARPIQIGIFRFGRALPVGPVGYVLCAVATVTVAFAVAWYLERRLQPAITARFGRRFATGATFPCDPTSPGHRTT